MEEEEFISEKDVWKTYDECPYCGKYKNWLNDPKIHITDINPDFLEILGIDITKNKILIKKEK